MSLNEKEAKILEQIRDNPFISQQVLANEIGLSRSAIANLISGLVKKEYLLGKAYVLNDAKPVVCIGGANVDRRYILEDKLVHHTSNSVKSRMTVGGVARNVAENLGRLEFDVSLLSIAGNDPEWKMIESASKYFMDTNEVDTVEDSPTGSFVEIIDSQKNLLLGLADMDVYNQMTAEWLTKHVSLLKRARFIVVDLNCTKEAITFLIAFATKYDIPLAILSVSSQKMINIPENLHNVKLLIVKHDETADYFGLSVESDEELESAAKKWLEYGVERVMVTKNNEKVMTAVNDGRLKLYLQDHETEERYSWGVNEALCSGILYAFANNFSEKETMKTGLANAYYTSHSVSTVRSDLSKLQLTKNLEEYEKIRHTQY